MPIAKEQELTHNEGSGIYFLRYAKGQESKEKNKKIKQGYLANSRATSEFTITNSLKSPYRIVTMIQKDYSGEYGYFLEFYFRIVV